MLVLALEEATIADIHAAYRAGTCTVHAVMAACLARIAAYDKDGPLSECPHHRERARAR